MLLLQFSLQMRPVQRPYHSQFEILRDALEQRAPSGLPFTQATLAMLFPEAEGAWCFVFPPSLDDGISVIFRIEEEHLLASRCLGF
jgi:hypothetical protein